jgi:hypothetical protein
LPKLSLMTNLLIALFMIVMGIAMAIVWSAVFFSSRYRSQGDFFNWKEGENLIWPHIFAEFMTAIALVFSGIGIILIKPWSVPSAFLSLGALIYSSINSSSWVLANKDRLIYGVPMWGGFAGAVVSVVLLIKNTL